GAGLAAIGMPVIIIGVAVLLFILFLLAATAIGANTPLAVNGVAVTEGKFVNDDVAEEVAESYYDTRSGVKVGYDAQASLQDIQLMKYAVQTIFAKAKNWYYTIVDGVSVKTETGEEVTDEDILKLQEAGDYEGVLNVYRQLIDQYLEKSYSEARERVLSQASSLGYDEGLTNDSFNRNVNVFSNVNYASILAAYSIGDNYEYTSLARFKSELRKIKWCTEDMTRAEQEQIEPYIVYSYLDKRVEVDYMEYLRKEGNGSIAMQNAVKKSLNTEKWYLTEDQSKWDEKKQAYQRSLNTAQKNYNDAIANYNDAAKKRDYYKALVDFIKMFNSKYQETDTYKSYIYYANLANTYLARANAYQNEINSLKKSISDCNTHINDLQKQIDKINKKYDEVSKDRSKAKISMVKYHDDKKEITVYYQETNADGSPVVKETLGKEYLDTGKEIPKFEELTCYSNLKDNTYYEKSGTEVVYPKLTVIAYGEVRLTAANTTGEFLIKEFGYEPKGEYELSKDAPNPITNLQAYQNFYDVIAEKSDLATYVNATTGVSINTFGDVYTATQIEEMINAAGNISGNRKEILKYALSLCGRVMYQWGGRTTNLGWQSGWGTQTLDGKDIGLDCSGFVQWCVHNAMPEDNVWQLLNTTATITSNCIPINGGQLKPGDLGTTEATGKHVGIFLGYDAQGNQLWVHAPQTGECIKVSARSFNYYWRIPSANIEGNNFESETYDPLNLTTVTNIDEMYVITYTLYGEARTDDGLRAVSEACNNHSIASNISMYDQVTYYNGKSYYLDAYKRLFVVQDAEFIKNCPVPTSTQYEIVQDAMNGTRVFFKNGDTPHPVMYWRSHGTNPGSKYTFVKEVGGNDFYYAN
nr:C40 family peptidase [Bacteroidaceae bacterium]